MIYWLTTIKSQIAKKHSNKTRKEKYLLLQQDLAISTDFLRRLALLPATPVHPATPQCHPKSSSKPLPTLTSHLHQLPPSLPPTILPSLRPSPLPTLSTSPPSLPTLPYSLQSAACSQAPWTSVGGSAPGGPSSVAHSPVPSGIVISS